MKLPHLWTLLSFCCAEALQNRHLCSLELFKSGPFPSQEDVLRRCLFFLWSMTRKDANLAAWNTAKSLLTHWAPSKHPHMTRENVKGRGKRLYDRFCQLRNAMAVWLTFFATIYFNSISFYHFSLSASPASGEDATLLNMVMKNWQTEQ